MAEFERIAEVDAVQPGGRLSLVVDDVPVLLIRIGDDYFAIEDICSHDGQPLTDGPIDDCEITCPRHGARFDVKTGAALCMPATEPIATFDVEVRDSGIYLMPPG